jgi:nucleoside-diphosphate-sugar epimerase
MRILITGGGGFLGAAIARALAARGDTAIAFDTQLGTLSHETDPNIIRVPGDITDLANVAQALQHYRPDAVMHCAAIVGVLSSLGSPLNVVRVNVEGSLNVLEAMRLADVQRCVHVSSEEAYGAFLADRIDETHALNPVLPYGICKAAVEQLARTYRDLHGLEVIHLRTSWVYGPGLPRERVPKTLVEAALSGHPLHVASGAEVKIDHTYVDDFVTGALSALDHRTHRYDVYNIASGEAPTIAQIIEIIRSLVPGAQLSAGTGPYRHGDQVTMVRKGALDVGRAAADLGWRPRYGIRAGLARYVELLRAGKQ